MKTKQLLSLIFCCALWLGGCSNTGSQSEQSTLTDFEVVLDWYPNAVHGFIYQAIEKGYYAQEGLNVIVRFPANTNDAISLTAAGKAQMGIYYMHDVIRARADQNVPIKAVGTVVQDSLNIVLSLEEKGIKQPKDLLGKTIGESGSQLSAAMIRTMVESEGVSMEDVDVIDVGFDLLSAMTTGNVDATLGCMVNHEVPALEDNGFSVNYFYPTDYGIPAYYELVFVTGEKQIEENKKNIEGFLRASAKGFADMKANPEETVDILLNNQNAENFPLKKEVEQKSIQVLLPAMETETTPFLSQDAAVWEENILWLQNEGILDHSITPQDVMTTLYE